jgi:hypothetical protein
MKKCLLIICTFLSLQTFAQVVEQNIDDMPENRPASQTIEALKTAYITKELNLTVEEAQKFWPTYNAYTTEMKKARQELKEDIIAFEEKKITILKKYKDDFKKVLNNDDRVRRCFKVEPQFHILLRNEWQRRQNLRPKNGLFNKNPPHHNERDGNRPKPVGPPKR